MSSEITLDYQIDPDAGSLNSLKNYEKDLAYVIQSPQHTVRDLYEVTNEDMGYVIPKNHPYLLYLQECHAICEQPKFNSLKEFIDMNHGNPQRKISYDQSVVAIMPRRNSREDMTQIVTVPETKIIKKQNIIKVTVEKYKPQLWMLKKINADVYQDTKRLLAVAPDFTFEDALIKRPDLLAQVNRELAEARHQARTDETHKNRAKSRASPQSNRKDTDDSDSAMVFDNRSSFGSNSNIIPDDVNTAAEAMDTDPGIMSSSMVPSAAPNIADLIQFQISEHSLQFAQHQEQQFATLSNDLNKQQLHHMTVMNENLIKLQQQQFDSMNEKFTKQQQHQFNVMNESFNKLTNQVSSRFNEDAQERQRLLAAAEANAQVTSAQIRRVSGEFEAQKQQLLAVAEANALSTSAQLQQVSADVAHSRSQVNSVASALEEKLKVTQDQVTEVKQRVNISAQRINHLQEAQQAEAKPAAAAPIIGKPVAAVFIDRKPAAKEIIEEKPTQSPVPTLRTKTSLQELYEGRPAKGRRQSFSQEAKQNSAPFTSAFGNDVAVGRAAISSLPTQSPAIKQAFAQGPRDSPGFQPRSNFVASSPFIARTATQTPALSPALSPPSSFNPSPLAPNFVPNYNRNGGAASSTGRTYDQSRDFNFNPGISFDSSPGYGFSHNGDDHGNAGNNRGNARDNSMGNNGNGFGNNGNGFGNQPPLRPNQYPTQTPYQYPQGNGFPPSPLIVPAIKPPELKSLSIAAVRLFCEQYASYQNLYREHPAEIRRYAMHSKVYCIHQDTLQQLGFILYLQPTAITDADFTRWAAEHLGRRAEEYEKDVFKVCEDGLSWDYKERDPSLAVSAYLQRCCKLLRNNALSHLYDSADQRLLCKVLRLNLPSNLAKEVKKYQDQIDPAVSRDIRVFQQVVTYILQKQSYGLALGELSSHKSRKDKHKDSKDHDRRSN